METQDTKKRVGRPNQYGTKTVMMAVTLPAGLVEALDAYVATPKGRSKAVAALLAQALNYDLNA